MATGTVKWFNGTKGYGFIQPDSGGKDVFVHISAVERSGLNGLHEGQKITYEIQQDRGKERPSTSRPEVRQPGRADPCSVDRLRSINPTSSLVVARAGAIVPTTNVGPRGGKSWPPCRFLNPSEE
jgi:cold shock protein